MHNVIYEIVMFIPLAYFYLHIKSMVLSSHECSTSSKIYDLINYVRSPSVII
jgi:Gpi18-like mannosyltransferase